MVKFFIVFVHRLLNQNLQFVMFGLHGLLMVVFLWGGLSGGFINRKSLLNNNNNNILLL